MVDDDRFKVGDRVRALAEFDYGSGMKCEKGELATIVQCDGDGSPKAKFDNGSTFYVDDTQLALIEPANDELAELRVWRDAAIKRFPELAPPKPETDEEKADWFEEEYWDDRLKKPRDLALAAIAWARANPR